MSEPSTTIVPFTNTQVLPTCATACGPLYDANGGCVPPAVDATLGSTAFTSCFCANTAVTAFSSQATGVCDDACATDGLSSIQKWFQSICSVDTSNNQNADSNADTSATATATAKASSGGGDWLSNHWKWVIMLVILVVGITGIWIGACIWRRRYVRNRDRQTSLGQKQSGSVSHPSWGPGVGSGSEAPDPAPAGYDSQRNSHAVLTAGAPAPAASAAAEKPAKKDKKRWVVKERT